MQNKCLSHKIIPIVACCSILTLTACGGSSSQVPVQTLDGTLSAPGGTVALKEPTILDHFYAAIVGKQAAAALEGVSPVTGEVVELIQVDIAGDQVGAVIASGTSASDGSFSINLPNGFVLEANMVARAGGLLDARVDDISDVTVNPVSNAASQLIVDNNIDLSALTVDEVAEINNAVEDIAQNVEGLTGTITDYTDALKSEATNDESTIAIVGSTDSTGSICGTVTNASSTVLENIRVVVKTFSDPVTVGKIKTATDGSYCVNVDDGQYIVGAFNYTGTNTAASEWYTTGSPTGAGGTSQFDADKVTISGTTPFTADFQLQPGARISGNVLTAAGGTLAEGAPLEGVQVQIRDYDSFIPITSPKVKADGSYRVNVPAGKYLLFARNKTRFPYASQFYDTTTGSPTRNGTVPVTVAAGDDAVNNFNLKPGVKISGIVTDGAVGSSGMPVPGVRVRVDMNTAPGGPAARLRTNKEGKYRIWLEGGSYGYRLASRGQRDDTNASPLSANTVINFDAEMIRVKANITLGASGPAVREAKVILDDMGSNQFSQELTNASGDVELYAPITGYADSRLRVVIDSGQFIASEHYLNQTTTAGYNSIVIAAGAKNSINDVGAWPLIAGGILQGTVYTDSTKDTAEPGIKIKAQLSAGGGFFVSTSARSDGTYMMSLPPGTYDQIRVEHATSAKSHLGTVLITADEITTLDSTP